MTEGRTGIPRRVRCSATIDNVIRCEQAPDHDGRHTNGLLSWHEPPLILVDGVEPDLAVESEHWQNGEVRLSWQEPRL
jgi:hypothetical protein